MLAENFLPIVSIVWSFCTGLGAVVAVVWNIRGMVARFEEKMSIIQADIRAEFGANLKILEQEQADKRDTIYRRFDDHKKFVDDTFVRSKECGIMHQNTVIGFDALKTEVKELRKEIAEVKELVLRK